MKPKKNIFLADDDADDRLLFEEALREISDGTQLTMAHDGQQLMTILENAGLPDVIFLDLNMPRKNGMECLLELKQSPKLKHIPIVIFSTSTQLEMIDKVYEGGAHYYISKPRNFVVLKNIIRQILGMNWHAFPQPSKEKFILQPQQR
jgi:CheY-like chemotaxis protein